MRKIYFLLLVLMLPAAFAANGQAAKESDAEAELRRKDAEFKKKVEEFNALLNSTGTYTEKGLVLGNETWALRNLDADRFRNGDLIPQAKNKEEWVSAAREKRPVWCNHGDDAAKGTTYGKLYNWYAVTDPRGLAPAGWHLASDEEWENLVRIHGGIILAGDELRSTSGWKAGKNGNNKSGFNGLPGNCRFSWGAFGTLGDDGFWWTNTAKGNAGYGYRIEASGLVSREAYGPGDGLSVRCVKNR